MLCLGTNTKHCNGWDHTYDTPSALASGTRISAMQSNGARCRVGSNNAHTLFKCNDKNQLPLRLYEGTGQTTQTVNTFFRWGYVNDGASTYGKLRVGWTGDDREYDTSDSRIGIGLDSDADAPTWRSNCGARHSYGSGYLMHCWGNGAVQGSLFVRDSSEASPTRCTKGVYPPVAVVKATTAITSYTALRSICTSRGAGWDLVSVSNQLHAEWIIQQVRIAGVDLSNSGAVPLGYNHGSPGAWRDLVDQSRSITQFI